MKRHAGHFKPGQSGNPGGRPVITPETKKILQKNGELAAKIMNEILSDPDAFGREGYIGLKEQPKWLQMAQERAWGRMDVVEHAGMIEHQAVAPTPKLQAPSMDEMPERKMRVVNEE